MMKIKKGAEVRILRTNQIANIADIELIRKGGKVHKYCHVITPNGQPDLWLDSSELADVKETCVITFENSNGQACRATLELDHRKNNLAVKIKAVKPTDLKSQSGLHVSLMAQLMTPMRVFSEG